MGEMFRASSGIDQKEIHHFIFSLHAAYKQKKKVFYYRVFRERYPDIWETYIERFFKTVGIVPLYEFVQTIVEVFHLPKHFGEQYGFVMRFLEFIKEEVARVPWYVDRIIVDLIPKENDEIGGEAASSSASFEVDNQTYSGK